MIMTYHVVKENITASANVTCEVCWHFRRWHEEKKERIRVSDNLCST